MTEHKPVSVKLVVVGDGAVGKTCLLVAYAKGKFPEEYVPTVFENYSSKLLLDDKVIDLGLWDTAGQETYKNLRPLSYQLTSVFMICFSITMPTSLENVTEEWWPEVQQYDSSVPCVLIGTKLDLRDDESTIEELKRSGKKPVTKEQGEHVAKEIKAEKYIECSAKTGENLKNVFIECVRVHLNAKTKKKGGGGCQIL